eukprot:TRINITY_DN4664_c0_g2_i2.p1 TRINITY_DN4664_c0_g2~~TRINITY_DN4664_c0_g2_i2.p1  ORF type:complete len:152 (-),score=33.25 TRINITY_DN4664_c0_g2_i2:513-968(-)
MGCCSSQSSIEFAKQTSRIKSKSTAHSDTSPAKGKPSNTPLDQAQEKQNATPPPKTPTCPAKELLKAEAPFISKQGRFRRRVVRRGASRGRMRRITELSNEDSSEACDARDPKEVLLELGYDFVEECEEKENANAVGKLDIPGKRKNENAQ